MDFKFKLLLVSGAVGAAFVLGRYTVPEKVKIETKIVEVEKKQVDTSKNKRKETTIVDKINPDGSKETTTKIIEDTNIDKTVNLDKNINKDSSKEIVSNASKVTISALGALDINTGKMGIGASITKPILGPVTIGAFGISTGQAGVSLGLTF